VVCLPYIYVTSKTLKLGGSFLFGVLILAVLIFVLLHLRDSLAWLSCALGLAAGWAVGILLAPYQSEQERFREYAKFVSAFITGYLVSKLDRIFDLWLDPEHGPLVLHSIVAHRMMICITSFLLAAVSTYVARKYVSFGRGSEQPRETH
jgi:hypothetical protein